jgi:uncharacterized membrane protein YhiD involved in acid resistance
MNIKKPLLIAGAVTTIGAAGLISSQAAFAATSTSGSTSLVDKIAQRFNLNKADVQAVFDENKAERQAEMQAKVEAKLNQAVTDGKLTTEQKYKILAKRQEFQATFEANKDAMKDNTPEERRADREAKRTELEQWAKDNNIPTEYLRFVAGHGGRGHGPGGPGPASFQSM